MYVKTAFSVLKQVLNLDSKRHYSSFSLRKVVLNYRLEMVGCLNRIDFAFLLNFVQHCELLLAGGLALEACGDQLV